MSPSKNDTVLQTHLNLPIGFMKPIKVLGQTLALIFIR